LLFFDRFLIGRMIGAAAIGIYVLPFSVITQLQILPSALMRAMFPELASSSDGHARQAIAVATDFVGSVMACCLALAAPFIVPLLGLWVGWKTGLAASPVAFGLIPGIWANGVALVTAVALQARANTRFLALVHLAEVVPYLGLLYVGIQWAGPTGAALAWSARCAVDALIICAAQKVKARVGRLLTNAAGLAAISAISLLLPVESPVRWTGTVILSGMLAWHAWSGLPANVRGHQKEMLRKFRFLRTHKEQ
jgi:O-antigen/teichoic acid export membrane protein